MSVAIQTSDRPTDRIAVVLGDIDRLLDELFEVPSSIVDDESLAQGLVAMHAVQTRVEAAHGRLLTMARERALAARRGHRRLEHQLLADTPVSGREARARVRRTDWLREFPRFAAAHESGVMSAAHVERVRRSLDNPRTRLALRRDERIFIDAARTCSFADFEKVCDYWRIAADPDGAEPAEQVAQTSVTARRRSDGMVEIDGLLDPLSGQVFLAAWDAETQRLAVADDESGERRSIGVRGAEALLRLVARGSARADGSHPDPLVHIVMSQQVAEAAMQRFAFGADVPVDTDPFDLDKRCELIDGTPIHPRLALAALGIAALNRVVFDAASRPIDVSYASRGFPKWLKHLLLLRSRGRCENDGCDSPYPWLQVDHDLAHSKGGRTTRVNGVIRCRPCNLAKGDR